MKTVVLVGSLDTKGREFAYVKDLLEKRGLRTFTVDWGVLGAPAYVAEISREEVARAGEGDLARWQTGLHKDEAMRGMARGLTVVIRRLYGEDRFDGIFGMGGSNGTSVSTTAMRTLPVGMPKLMVSTMGGGDVSAFAGTKDITFMPSIVDVAGFNRISRRIYTNAAGAIAGLVEMEVPSTGEEKPLVAASMFGNTTKSVDQARELLEGKGYEVLVFHAVGTGGLTMEGLIADGYIAASLDITTTELADYVCGGVLSAGPDRCMAASRAGVPALLVPGCVDMANFGAVDTVPEKYRGRLLYEWNPNVTLLRTNVEENRRIGELLAAAANAATGPVAFLIPLGGISMLDSQGQQFWDPEADRACFETIKSKLRPGIPYIEVPENINDQAFSERAVETLLGLLEQVNPVGAAAARRA